MLISFILGNLIGARIKSYGMNLNLESQWVIMSGRAVGGEV
jgi:hypothetical protein